MAGSNFIEDNEDTEATNFRPTTHMRHFDSVLCLIFNRNIHDWAVCLTGDNSALNQSIANLMEELLIGFCNHKLNLQVQRMVKQDSLMRNVFQDMQNIMKACRNGLKYTATLRKLEGLSPVVSNPIRWSAKYHMIARFNKIRRSLITVADTDGIDFPIDRSLSFSYKARKWKKMLDEINQVTSELQRKHSTLAECKNAVNILTDSVQMERVCEDSPFYQCRLVTNRIEIDSPIAIHPEFESAVIKIQKGEKIR